MNPVKEEARVQVCGLMFKRQCPLKWENLAATADPRVRHCRTCEREVYFCASDEETLAHAGQGHCIAREASPYSELRLVGEPDRDWLRGRQPALRELMPDVSLRRHEGIPMPREGPEPIL